MAKSPKTDSADSLLRFFPAPNPFSLITVVFVISLIVAPLIYYPFDVESCWLPWSRASLGAFPWRIYLTVPECNYPPLMLYVLTAQEALRKALHAEEVGTVSYVLTKLPSIFAHLGGALFGYFVLRRLRTEVYARRFALLYALALPLFVNGALWGQADSLLALAMLAAVLFLMDDKPIYAGVAFGIALSLKLQSIVIAPVLLLYTFRRYDAKTLGRAVGAGLVPIFCLALPFLLAGAGKQMLHAYTDAAGYYPLRTLNTFNIWGYLNYLDEYVKHIPGKIVNQDDRFALGPLTYRHIGIGLFSLSLIHLLICIWRHPNARTLAWASGLSVLAFVTLCTQMHERYWVPGAALLILVAPSNGFALAFSILASANAAWNQWLVLVSNYLQYHTLPEWCKASLNIGWAPSLIYVSLANVLLLIAGLFYVGRLTGDEEMPKKAADEKDGRPD